MLVSTKAIVLSKIRSFRTLPCDEREDIVQKTYLSALLHINQFKAKRVTREGRRKDFSAWISKIAWNDAINIYRKTDREMQRLASLKDKLEDSDIKKKIIINKAHLYRRLLDLESVIELGKSIESKYIYNAIRNCLSIQLFLKKIVNNKLIIKTIENNIGKLTANNLLDNKATLVQRDIALRYLKYLFRLGVC